MELAVYVYLAGIIYYAFKACKFFLNHPKSFQKFLKRARQRGLTERFVTIFMLVLIVVTIVAWPILTVINAIKKTKTKKGA